MPSIKRWNYGRHLTTIVSGTIKSLSKIAVIWKQCDKSSTSWGCFPENGNHNTLDSFSKSNWLKVLVWRMLSAAHTNAFRKTV